MNVTVLHVSRLLNENNYNNRKRRVVSNVAIPLHLPGKVRSHYSLWNYLIKTVMSYDKASH